MKRPLLRSSAFVRAARKLVKKHPALSEDLKATVELLSNDAFASSLKSHKLKGDLKDTWACSAGYDLRILFEFVEHDGGEAILLLTVGSHDEVY